MKKPPKVKLPDELAPYKDAKPVRLLILEPEPVTAFGLRQYLEKFPSFTICAEVSTVARAEAEAAKSQPELAIFDPEVDGGAGWGLLQRLHTARPRVRCVAWIRQLESGVIERALRGGAQVVVLRREEPEQVFRMLLRAAIGLFDMSPLASWGLAEGFASHPLVGAPVSGVQLTTRQQEVFGLLGEGLPTKEIADRLGISPKTAQTHLTRIREQLGLRTLAELRLHAMRDASNGRG
jgi:DNA-binding NarL/FixJ family response regulator